jgi:hypothetical protein
MEDGKALQLMLSSISAKFNWAQDRPWNLSNADYVAPYLR